VPVKRQQKEAVLLAHCCIIENGKQNTWSHFTPEDRRVGLLAKTYMHACTSIHKHTKLTALEFAFNKWSRSLLALSATLLLSALL